MMLEGTIARNLLRRVSWQAEKLLKQHGSFRTVIWLVEYSDGAHDWFETGCNAPPDATDDEALDVLRDEMRVDLGNTGAVAFACAYAADAITFLTTLARQPTTKRCEVVAIEAHDADTHLRAWREIIRLPGRAPTLGALSAVGSAEDSRYAALLAVTPVGRDHRLGQAG